MHIDRFLCQNLYSFRRPDVQSFNSKIRTFVQQGHYREALQLYTQILQSSVKPDELTFPTILKASAALLNLNDGKAIHASIVKMGFETDSYVASSLINMYAKCGSVDNATKVFDKMLHKQSAWKDVTLWNSLIKGHFEYGYVIEAIHLFHRMQAFDVKPDGFSISILLEACDDYSETIHASQIHAFVLRNGILLDSFLSRALIDRYLKCQRLSDAYNVFVEFPGKNVFVWNSMIAGFCQNGLWDKGLELFVDMRRQNDEMGSSVFSSVLTACSYAEDLDMGEIVHSITVKMGFLFDSYVCTSLLTMYGKCGFIKHTRKLFDEIPNKEIQIWNAMISAYNGNKYFKEALCTYKQLKLKGLKSDAFTNSTVLSGCSEIGSLDFGRAIHGEIMKRPLLSNVNYQSSLLTMYARCGEVEDASKVLKMIPVNDRDIVAWGSMIVGFCQNKKFKEALEIFKTMELEGKKPDSSVLTSVINACSGLDSLKLGFAVHGLCFKCGLVLDIYVTSALINMYAKYGQPELAKVVFSNFMGKNLVIWNSMISCYTQNGLHDQSLRTFSEILQNGLLPDSVTITGVLSAISSLSALLKGKMLHAYQLRQDILCDFKVENALIDMYMKCGCLSYAYRIFKMMDERSTATWNSMISGYGSHGYCSQAIQLFHDMVKLGNKPDEITFLALISSCSHSGFIEEGLEIFRSMKEDYSIVPWKDHYVNIVDLYGRAGRLEEAYNFIQTMPIEVDKSVWLCLLCACRVFHNVHLGEIAAGNLLRLEPGSSGNYVQLLNLYGEAKLWNKVSELRVVMKELGLKKNPGCSWIEVKDEVQVFVSGDCSCPRAVKIYDALAGLRRNMAEEKEDFFRCTSYNC